jgi:hypothetical protein
MKALRTGVAGVMVAFLLSLGLIGSGASIAQAADGVDDRRLPPVEDLWNGWVIDIGDHFVPVIGDFLDTVGDWISGSPRVEQGKDMAEDCAVNRCSLWDWADEVECAFVNNAWTNCGGFGGTGSSGNFGTAVGTEDWCNINRCGGWDGAGVSPVDPDKGIIKVTYGGLTLLDGKSQIQLLPGKVDLNGRAKITGCVWSYSQCFYANRFVAEDRLLPMDVREYQVFNGLETVTRMEADGSLSSLSVRGECSNANGTRTGLRDGTRSARADTFSRFLGTVGFRAGQPWTACLSGQTLEWIMWDGRDVSNVVDDPATAKRCYRGALSEHYLCMMPGKWENPGTAPQADRTVYRSTLVCVLQAEPHTAFTTVKEGPAGSGIIPQLWCPGGQTAKSGKTEVRTTFTAAWQLVSSWEIPDAAREKYAECLGYLSNGCAISVWIDNIVCETGREVCRDWYNNTYKYQPSRVQCKWGPYVIDMANCEPFINAFMCETGLVPNPAMPVGSALVCVDPRGKGLPTNEEPNPGPVGPPGQDGQDGGSGVPGGSGGVPVEQGPPSDPSPGGQNCWPTGFAVFNPVAWVLQPLKCGLSWAFVPPAADMSSIGLDLQMSFEGIGFGDALNTLTGPVNAMGAAVSGSGCAGPSMNFEVAGISQVIEPFNACSGTMATVAGYSRALISLTVIVSGGIAVIRALGRGFGFQFDMGGKGD